MSIPLFSGVDYLFTSRRQDVRWSPTAHEVGQRSFENLGLLPLSRAMQAAKP